VVDSNVGGRSTFKNAGRTSRRGAELAYAGRLGETLRTTWSLTALRARFADAFVSGSGASAVTVPAGNRLPGTPDRSLFGELAWAPRAGLEAAVELVHTGKLVVNDANEDAAPAATVVNLRAGAKKELGGWQLSALVRLDNAGDRRHAGSVIVNEANKRFFEPALPRNWTLAVSLRRAL
jgi:iron complex outermembrane receptor protein